MKKMIILIMLMMMIPYGTREKCVAPRLCKVVDPIASHSDPWMQLQAIPWRGANHIPAPSRERYYIICECAGDGVFPRVIATHTSFVCWVRILSSIPVSVSHILTVLSREAVANLALVDAKLTSRTCRRGP